MGDWSGTLWLPAALQKPTATQFITIRDAVAALTDARGAYTPTVRFGTTAWTLGNATVACFYLRSGKMVAARGRITIGSTTSFNGGTGNMTISLPVNAVSASSGVLIGGMYLFDAAPSVRIHQAWLNSVDRIQALDANGGGATNTSPWTWATGDFIDWSLVYEAA